MPDIQQNPWVPLGLSPSFGFGDRLGVATPGHVRALVESGGGIRPIFAQQSIREMGRTSRSPETVIADALAGMKAAGYTGASGADADHLKTTQDVDRTAAAGFVFFTIDPSEFVDGDADTCDVQTLKKKYRAVADKVDWMPQYSGKTIRLNDGLTIDLTEIVCQRTAVKYGRAINHTVGLASHIKRIQETANQAYEIELSVNETSQPTTLAEHYIIADQCRLRGVTNLVSVAPRYVGEFEKGVDFKGDLAAFERSLAGHAAIAAALGPYKLSLHSGSDKLSIYPAFARITKGLFHVKTAGTSYLEALRVVVRHEPALFHRVVDLARSRYEKDRATYHVSATLAAVPGTKGCTPQQLENTYLQRWSSVSSGGFTAPGRQIVHCTFGSILQDRLLGPSILQVVRENRGTYDDILAEHFGRHLRALQMGL